MRKKIKKAQNGLSPNASISGSSSNHYAMSASYVSYLFDTETDDANNLFNPGGSPNFFPTYSVAETSNYSIVASLPFTFIQPDNVINDATWSLEVYQNGALISSDTQYFTAGDPATSTLYIDAIQAGVFYAHLSDAIPSTDVNITDITANGSRSTTNCTYNEYSISLNSPDILSIAAGHINGSRAATSIDFGCYITSWKYDPAITVNGTSVVNGSTITIGGTIVTIVLSTICNTTYAC